MKVWLLRHGEAGTAASDAERALTARGQRDAQCIGQWLAAQALAPAVVAVSPLRRAQQTLAAVLAAGVRAQALAVHAHLVPEADARHLLAWLADQHTDCLLVGHNPLLSQVLAVLRDGRSDPGHSPQLGTAHLACLEGEVGLPGRMRLRHVITPDAL